MKKLIFSLVATASFVFANGYVTYEVDGKKYEGYYSSPSKDAPLVYMVHDWDGLTDYEVKRTKMLNEMGYAVFAVDLFGKGIRPTKVIDKKQHTGELYKDREKMRKLLYAGLETAKKQGANTKNTLGMGYCFGGAAILEFGRSGAPLKSFVSFHGGLKTPKGQDYSKTKGNIVVFHGTADKIIPMSQFANLASDLEKTGIKHEMITYGGAPHAFTVFGSKKYHEEADKNSWKRFSKLLKMTLK